MNFPQISYPNNELIQQKTEFTIKLWQKLCICYAIFDIRTKITQPKSLNSTQECIQFFNELMKKYASELIEFYSDAIPRNLTVQELCSKSEMGFHDDNEIDFYEYQFNQIKSQLFPSYFTLFERVKNEMGESASIGDILSEFRRKLQNRFRRKKLDSQLTKRWYPVEWLCFISFGMDEEKQKLFKFNETLSIFIRSDKITSSIDDKVQDIPRIIDFPKLCFVDNTIPMSFTPKNVKYWQRLCVSFTMMEYFQYRRTTSEFHPNEKLNHLQQSYRLYAKLIVRHYVDYIPKELTADILCLSKFDMTILKKTSSEIMGSSTFLTGQKIYRLWTDITPKINHFAMRAWVEEILGSYSELEIKSMELRPAILTKIRQRWWALQCMSDSREENQSGSVTKLPKRQGVFNPNWFPLEWFTFICFGPLSNQPYFRVSRSISGGYRLVHEQQDIPSLISPNIISNPSLDCQENSPLVRKYDECAESVDKSSHKRQKLDDDSNENNNNIDNNNYNNAFFYGVIESSPAPPEIDLSCYNEVVEDSSFMSSTPMFLPPSNDHDLLCYTEVIEDSSARCSTPIFSRNEENQPGLEIIDSQFMSLLTSQFSLLFEEQLDLLSKAALLSELVDRIDAVDLTCFQMAPAARAFAAHTKAGIHGRQYEFEIIQTILMKWIQELESFDI